MSDFNKLATELANRLNPDEDGATPLTFSQQVEIIESAIEDAYKSGYRQAQEDS